MFMIKNDKKITDNFLGGEPFQLLPDEVIRDVVGGKLSSKKKASIIASVAVVATVAVIIFCVARKMKSKNHPNSAISFLSKNGGMAIVDWYNTQVTCDKPYRVEMSFGDSKFEWNFSSSIEAKAHQKALVSQNEMHMVDRIRTFFGLNT